MKPIMHCVPGKMKNERDYLLPYHIDKLDDLELKYNFCNLYANNITLKHQIKSKSGDIRILTKCFKNKMQQKDVNQMLNVSLEEQSEILCNLEKTNRILNNKFKKLNALLEEQHSMAPNDYIKMGIHSSTYKKKERKAEILEKYFQSLELLDSNEKDSSKPIEILKDSITNLYKKMITIEKKIDKQSIKSKKLKRQQKYKMPNEKKQENEIKKYSKKKTKYVKRGVRTLHLCDCDVITE